MLEGIPKRLTGYKRVLERRRYSIELIAVHIKVETEEIEVDESKQWRSRISAETLQELELACKRPFSLIIADFGYATEAIFDFLYKTSETAKLTSKDLEGKILTTADLADSVIEYCSTKSSLLTKHFINSFAKFILYSYVSGRFYFAFGSLADRVNLTKSRFQNCRVEPVDTKEEFYGGEEFNSHYSNDYYSHQASILINRIVQHEFVGFILKDSQRRRFDRVKQAASIVGILTIVGFASEFSGEYVFKIYDKGDTVNGMVFGLISVFALVVIGAFISYFIEEKLAKVSEIESVSEETDH